MQTKRIPRDVAAAIEECWPDGIVEQFDTSESYFYDICSDLRGDLLKIRDVAMFWETEEEEESGSWDDDDDDEPPLEREFQSYHMCFLAPRGDEFEFETETEGPEPSEEDPLEEVAVTYAGRAWLGCWVTISLASPFALLSFGEYAEFEDGSEAGRDGQSPYREDFDSQRLAKLGMLRDRIARVLEKHHIALLDHEVLDLPVPDLRADEEVFLEPPLKVADAFFFRGV